MPLPAFLDREHIVAPPGYNRWLVPPAALAVHLSIGQAYSLSVFNLPMSRLLGITDPAPGDWSLTTTVWIFNIAFFFLGVSAALFGRWVERAGPRKAMAVAAVFWFSGFLLSALGVYLHQIALVYLGYGVLGGIGLGLGYLSPVSTLLKWFPDRPGMATGMAIMGFGGGALVGSPLAVGLMEHFKSPTSVGVWQAFLVMGFIYLGFMLFGAVMVRVPPAGWKPASPVSPASIATAPKLVPVATVSAAQALRTPQFWLLWIAFCMNTTAGISILSQASPLIQEMFPGVITPSAAVGFVGLLSLFNLTGRFGWSSLSDRIGRKTAYLLYLGADMVLLSLIPSFGHAGSVALFVLGSGLIISMYGGGFATMPAYLKDLFGAEQVGQILGRILTAWSTAAILGPSLLTYIREYQLNHGVPKAQAYGVTMYIMAGLLFVGFLCAASVRPVHERHHYKGGPA